MSNSHPHSPDRRPLRALGRIMTRKRKHSQSFPISDRDTQGREANNASLRRTESNKTIRADTFEGKKVENARGYTTIPRPRLLSLEEHGQGQAISSHSIRLLLDSMENLRLETPSSIEDPPRPSNPLTKILAKGLSRSCSSSQIPRRKSFPTNTKLSKLADVDLENILFSIRPLHWHGTVWDLRDVSWFFWVAQLHIKMPNSPKAPLVIPDPSRLEITFQSHVREGRHAQEHNDPPTYRTQFEGEFFNPTEDEDAPRVSSFNILTTTKWRPFASRRGVKEWTRMFWVPVPVSLFRKMETRTFWVEARVWFRGETGCLDTNAEITLSRLRAEKEMV